MIPARFARLVLLALAAGLLLLACHKKEPGDPPVVDPPPNRPLDLWEISHTAHSATLRWNDRSDNETGFYVYLRAGADTLWSCVDTAGRDVVQVRIEGLTALTLYHFRVTAYNENGESIPSAELELTTVGVAPPSAPTAIETMLTGESVVRVSWTDSVAVDSFLIERRTAADTWLRLGSTPGTVYLFHDSLVAEETLYYYRVGAAGEGGVAWSADSSVIQTPLAGVPLPPDSLTATAVLGEGVQLTWLDRSGNEAGFAIGRGVYGHAPVVVDTVAANAVAYFDSLGTQMDRYNYYVRAFNDIGLSAWSPRASVDYRYCSPGLIPLCLSNQWEYDVDSSAGAPYTLYRRVLSHAFVDSIDYYLIGQYRGLDIPDSLYYLRNYDNIGTLIREHPLTTATPDTLFHYPPSGLTWWEAQSDCVIVTATNTSVQLSSGMVYEHLVSYQRFFTVQHSIQYFIKPGLGIVREDEWMNGNRTRRDLVTYVVIN